MSRFSPGRSLRQLARLGPRPLSGVVWLLALLLCAWLGARLYWRLAAPDAVSALSGASSDPHEVARLIAARSPFGGQTRAVASAPPPFKLIGVATGFGSDPGFAILQAGDDAPVSVLVGESVVPGVRLVALFADRVAIEIGGVRRELALRGAAPAGGSAPVASYDESEDEIANKPAVRPAPPHRPALPGPALQR